MSSVSLFHSEMENINSQIRSQHALSRRAIGPLRHFSDSGQTTDVLLCFQVVAPHVFRMQVLHTSPRGNGEFPHFLSMLA